MLQRAVRAHRAQVTRITWNINTTHFVNVAEVNDRHMAQRPQPLPLRRTNGVSDPPCYSFSHIDEAAGRWNTPSTHTRRVGTQEPLSDKPSDDDIKSSPDSYIWISLIALLFSPFYGWLSVTLSRKCHY